MSRENLDLVLRALRAVAREPDPDIETINEVFHPDHVFRPVETDKLGEAEVKGALGYRDWRKSIASVTPWHMELEGAIDIGPSTVLAVVTLTARGTRSGAALGQRTWLLVRIAHGKVIRTEAYFDPAEALEVARSGS